MVITLAAGLQFMRILNVIETDLVVVVWQFLKNSFTHVVLNEKACLGHDL